VRRAARSTTASGRATSSSRARGGAPCGASRLEDPHEAVRLATRWSVEFALASPADAQLLLSYSRSTLLDGEPDGAIAEELASVNAPIERAVRGLAVRCYGTDAPEALERISYAVMDLPYAVLRRHLLAGTLGERTATTLEPAVRALVDNPEELP
jgi:hypothetical protein